ncbi:MAG: cell division protein ZipA C-terminal FtsZ-binding domain-containing protein [Burkholderiales bacterium]
MTDLEESLIAIGGAIVVGVFLLNKWQEYKTKKSVERAFSSSHDDVLMKSAAAPAATDSGRHEPSFSGEFTGDFSGKNFNDEATQEEGRTPPVSGAAGLPVDGDAETDAHAANAFTRPPPKDLPVDSMIDYSIPMAMAAKMRGDKIMRSLQTLRHIGNKPVHFIGQREDGVWETIAHGSVYIALQAGVQLANRGSALNELEYSELVSRLRQVSDEIDAEPDVPDMTEVMKSARALHQLVNQFDAKLSVNIQSNGAPWAIGVLLAALERQGFDLRPDGRLVMPDGDGGVLFMLSTNVTLAAETSSRLTLLLDVPCVALQRNGYGAMISFAKALAARMEGSVVDDAGQPLSDAELGEIADQVQAFYNEMEDAGIPAGSTRAHRLFS